jgi:hypothetical protein
MQFCRNDLLIRVYARISGMETLVLAGLPAMPLPAAAPDDAKVLVSDSSAQRGSPYRMLQLTHF